MHLLPRPAPLAGREGLLTELAARLTDGGGSAPQVAVLCGLGGVGKTSLAIEYAYRQLPSLGVVWQFAAEDPLVLKTGYAELAAALGLSDGDPVAAVHRVLAARAGGWLLVFDNVTDAGSVRELLPSAGVGQVLITTQRSNWPFDQLLHVPVLDDEKALEFLLARTGGTGSPETAKALATELGGLPLALEQAAAYMAMSGLSMPSYLDLFRTRRAELLARGKATGYGKQVTTAWTLAFDQLKATPPAVSLLRLLACYAPESIPLDLLLQRREGLAASLDRSVAPLLKPLLDDRLTAADAVAALRSYSLVGPPANGVVSVHRLVQAVTLEGLSAKELTAWRQAAGALIQAALPSDTNTPANWPAFAALASHAQEVLDLADTGIGRIADYFGNSGNYGAGRDLWQQIAEALLTDLGPDNRSTLTARHQSARWAGAAGDAGGARDQFAVLLPVYERVFGPDHPDTLSARHNLANWAGQAGDAAGARDQFAVLLPGYERVLGPDHPDTLATRHNLARWAGEAGDAAGARDRFVVLLPGYERVLGPDHPDTLATRHNLARWAGEAGDAAGARDRFVVLLPIRERVLGPDHPDTLSTRRLLEYWTKRAEEQGRNNTR